METRREISFFFLAYSPARNHNAAKSLIDLGGTYARPVLQELRLPPDLPPGEPVEFEKQVLAYLSTLAYRNLHWCEDKWVRDTGPFMNTRDAIVHPPVRVFYSPE